MHILIVKLSSIGDVVHTLPSLAALRRAFPDSYITWIVERKAASILENNSYIDQLIEIDTRKWRKDLLSRETWQIVRQKLKQIKQRPVDVALDFQGLLKSGLVAFLSGAARRIGFESSALREPASEIFLTDQIAVNRNSHMIEKNLSLLRALNVTASGRYEFPIAIAPEDEEIVEKQLAKLGAGQFAIINPGGGWPTKLWRAENYGPLCDWLWERYKLFPLITYGPGEEALADAVLKSSKRGCAQKLDLTLKQFVALARKAKLFVGSDTGPLHLAAAVGTPIVSLFGPTPAEVNGPFDPNDEVVGRSIPCRVDCYRRSCSHWTCMDIPVEAIKLAVERRMR